MEIIRDIAQGSDDWHALRYGWCTASRFKDVMAKGQGKTRKSYMMQLAAEAITDMRIDTFTSEYMQWGTDTEPQARANYELFTGNDVEEVAFIRLSEDHKIGCSPDGIVGDDGMVEFKCPKTTTQIETYLSGKMPNSHNAQVQGQLWVSDRQWCDFVSFDPRITGTASYFQIRIDRDEKYITELADTCFEFERELALMINSLI